MRKNTSFEWRFSGWLLIAMGIFFIVLSYALLPQSGFQYMGFFIGGLGAIILIVQVVKEVEFKKNDKILQDQLLRDGISSLENLTPYEFEEWVARLMRANGYKAYVTKYSGDYGLDVIAEKNNLKIGIQVKKFGNAVGVKAVQEVIAGMRYYDCDEGWVITTAGSFTQAAVNLATKSGIILYTRNDIAKLIK